MDSHTDNTENVTITFECNCEHEKNYRLTFDGGDSGNYIVEYCQRCCASDDRQFMVSMEMLS
jgi:hypothetical protein